jgi:hypothetical protein
MTGQIAHKGDKHPSWPPVLARRTDQRLAQRLQPAERRVNVIDAFFDLADIIITVRSLIRQAWTTCRWDTRPARRP